MDGLKKYNIERLSYSTLSNFRERQDLWFLQKICGYKFPSNPAMKRGNYVEEGIHAHLSEKGNIDEVCDVTTQLFASHCKQYEYDVEKTQKEIPNIARGIKEGVKKLAPFGKPVSYQKQIDIELLGVTIRGYTDFEFLNEQTGELFFIDLKTSSQLKKKVSFNHNCQTSIYNRATNTPQKVLYVRTSANPDSILLDAENDSKYIEYLERQIKSMNLLLEKFDKEELKQLIVPNVDAFHWDKESVKARKEVWGI
tara:strand:+ start:4697 stop:5455 length:759 start_codon:yes stop_codon:yes gene_type:complete